MACGTLKRRTEWDMSPLLSDPEDFACKRPRCPSLSPARDSQALSQFSPLFASTPKVPSTIPAAKPRKPQRHTTSISDVIITASTLPSHFRKRLNFDDSDDDDSEEEGLHVRKMVKTEHILPQASQKPTEENVLFTHAQVEAIVGRLVKEREAQLRELYEKTMAEQLDAQIESLVKFTEGNLKKSSSSSPPSYMS